MRNGTPAENNLPGQLTGHGDSVAARLVSVSDPISSAVGAHSDRVVDLLADSVARAVDAIRDHGDSVAGRIAETSKALSEAVGAQTDGVVDRIAASGAETVQAIQSHGDSVSAGLA